jgi:predicted DNA-binding transcriptional regulator AlpA
MSVTIPQTGFLRLAQVLAIIPLSKSTWFEGCRAGRYPKPVKIGPRASAWRAEDIAALVERLGLGEMQDYQAKLKGGKER